jgi:hypothetical protein
MGVKLDMIYLDMGHTYEDVKGDLHAILKYYSGTPILGDDYNFYDTTRRAVIEARIKYKIPYLDVDGNCYAFMWVPPLFHRKEPRFTIQSDVGIEYKYKERITVITTPSTPTLPPIPTTTFTIHKFNNWREYATTDIIKDRDNLIIIIPPKYKNVKIPTTIPYTIATHVISICTPDYSVDAMADLGVLIMRPKIARRIVEHIGTHTDPTIIRYIINQALTMEQIPIHYMYLSNTLNPVAEWGRNKYKMWMKRNEKKLFTTA